MRKTVLLVLLATAYTFHIQLTDARTALYANPYFAQLKLTDEQLEKASHDRVMMLDHSTGGHWVWLMVSWKPDVEMGINARGGTSPSPEDADLGLTPKEDDTLHVRCLAQECRVGETTLKNGEAVDVDPDVDVKITPKPPS